MSSDTAGFEPRLADLWRALDDLDPDDFLARLDTLVAELSPDSATDANASDAPAIHPAPTVAAPRDGVRWYEAALEDAGVPRP